MRISHKWSHTETIRPAQFQSHNLTYPHIKFRAAILQAQLTHLTFSFFFMWPLLELSARLSSRFHNQWDYLSSSVPLSHIFPHHLGLFLTQRSQINHHSNINSPFTISSHILHFTVSHFNTNSHVNVLISLLSTYTTHFHIHIILKSQIINSHHSYTQSMPIHA